MKAIVNPDICIGCTICTQVCPEVYKMTGDKAIAYVEPIPGHLQANAISAASQCPVNAISIEN